MGAWGGSQPRHRLSPLTRESLPEHALVVFADARPGASADTPAASAAPGSGGAPDVDDPGRCAESPEAAASRMLARELQELWDDGAEESARLASRMRRLAVFWVDLDADPDRMAADDAEMRVALALRMSPTSAHRHIHDAHVAVHELPGVHARLASGELPVTWMQQILRGVRDLAAGQRSEVDAEIAGWDLAWTPEQFRRRLSLLLTRIRSREPVPADRTPEALRRVEVFPVEDEGMACLRLLGPVPEITSLARRLDASARAVQAAQRRALEAGAAATGIGADASADGELVSGTGADARAAGATASEAGAALPALADSVPDIPFDDGTVLTTGRAMSLARLRFDIMAQSVLETGAIEIPSERFRINVVVPALTLLGASDAPATLDGTVPIPAAMARSLAGGEGVWHRVLTDPATGAFLPLPAQRYTPTAAMLEHLRLRNATCAVPGCTRPSSWASECDHIEEYDHRDPASGGLTEIENLHLLCWQHHQMKTAGRIDPERCGLRPRDGEPFAIFPSASPPEDPTAAPAAAPKKPTPDAASTGPVASDPEPDLTTSVPRPDVTDSVSDAPGGAARPHTVCSPGATRWELGDGSRVTVEDDVDVMTPRSVAELEVHWNRHLALVEEREQRSQQQHAQQLRARQQQAQPPWGPPPF